MPQNEVVGASGVRGRQTNNPDRTKTVTYHGEDIHDFAWTASPRYKVIEDSCFKGSMGPVAMRILMQPGALEPGAAARKNPARVLEAV